ncbi:MAG: mycofactocin biosynthesis glycosyltransferase MftF [Actinomycetota bacterium]
MRYELDSNARRSANGTALFGGSPFRMLRLSPRGAEVLDELVADAPATGGSAGSDLRDRLIDAGFIHPVLEPRSVLRSGIGFVIPVYEDEVGGARAIESIRIQAPDAPIVVVDDHSSRAVQLDGAMIVRHDENRGPAAARNTGVAALAPECDVVVFVDSDVVLSQGCVARLVAHLDNGCAAVAPRIRPEPGSTLVDRYEAHASPLDLGPSPAVVRPGSPVPYVPSTVVAVRRSVFHEVGGFDEQMRVGEDVDLAWRMVEHGAFLRYEPRAEARHRNRATWKALARQRHGYGTAAAALDRRHPGDVAPVEIPAPMLAVWSLIAFGGVPGLLTGGVVAAREFNALRDRIGDLPDGSEQTRSLVLTGHRFAVQWLTHAVRRAWLPVVGLAAVFSRRARRVLLASLGAPLVFDRGRNPVAGLLDDTAYCSGVWRGVLRERSAGALRPRTAPRAPRS